MWPTARPVRGARPTHPLANQPARMLCLGTRLQRREGYWISYIPSLPLSPVSSAAGGAGVDVSVEGSVTVGGRPNVSLR